VMSHDEGERSALKALVEGADWALTGTKADPAPPTDDLPTGPEYEETPPLRSFSDTRPAGFEPATSRSGGERSDSAK
jgi:hypothetical protein